MRLHLMPGLGNVRLAHLTALHIESWIAQAAAGRVRCTGNLSRASVAKAYSVLRAALRRAARWKLVPRSPCEDVDGIGDVSQEPRFLDAEAARHVLDTLAGTWLHLPAMLAIYAGLRRGEVCGLRWADLDLDAQTMTIRTSVETVHGVQAEKTPKSGKVETIAIPPGLADELRLRRALAGGEWVVCDEDGECVNPNSLSDRWHRWARANAVPVTFHGLRHTYASLMLTAGVNPYVAQQQLRHANLAMTRRYSHVRMTAQADAARSVGEILETRRGDS